jgi:hypothetical protein
MRKSCKEEQGQKFKVKIQERKQEHGKEKEKKGETVHWEKTKAMR